MYALIALGYTMVYGVLRFINFAHSDVFMAGAFAGFYLGPYFPATSLLGGFAVLAGAMVICAILGMAIEYFAYRPLRNSSRLNVLITAIGVSLLLENAGQKFFGADPKAFPTLFPSKTWVVPLPDWMRPRVPELPAAAASAPAAEPAPFAMGAPALTPESESPPAPIRRPRPKLILSSTQVTVMAVTAVLLVALQFIVQKTKIGTAMRALSFNPTAASLVGINTGLVISFTFALGSALAGAGGILYAINYPAIDPLMGILPGLKAFVAAVLGGIGNIPGAALGGLLLGVIETFVNGSPFSTYTDAIAFAILILILLFRPAGIFGKLQVEKV